jgi:hypothetical protein
MFLCLLQSLVGLVNRKHWVTGGITAPHQVLVFHLINEGVLVAEEKLPNCAFLYEPSKGNLDGEEANPLLQESLIIEMIFLLEGSLIFLEIYFKSHGVAEKFIK